jgi:hypothetical protein
LSFRQWEVLHAVRLDLLADRRSGPKPLRINCMIEGHLLGRDSLNGSPSRNATASTSPPRSASTCSA